MKRKPSDETYTEDETKKRMEAALRGARIAGHKQIEDVRAKRPKKKAKKGK